MLKEESCFDISFVFCLSSLGRYKVVKGLAQRQEGNGQKTTPEIKLNLGPQYL